MALKNEILKAGLRKGIAGEQKKAASRFERAEAVLSDRPNGLAAPRVEKPRPAGTFTGESAARTVVSAPLDLIRENPHNARRVYQPEKVKELAASIATHQQKVPAAAMQDPERPGGYVLIDGHYRLHAARLAGKATLDLVLEPKPLDETELYQVSFLLNQERNAQSALDNALAWRHLLDSGIVQKEEELVGLTGQSWANVNKTLAILRLPGTALDRMREAPEAFGVGIAYELTLLFKAVGEKETLDAIEKVIGERIGRRELEELRRRIEQPKKRKNKEVSRQYRIRSADGQQRGVIKEWDNGRVVLEVRLAETKEREGLVEELKRRFKVE